MPPYRRRSLAANSRPSPDRSRHPFPRPPPPRLAGRARPTLPTFYRPSCIPATRPGRLAASPHPGAGAAPNSYPRRPPCPGLQIAYNAGAADEDDAGCGCSV